VNRQRGVGPMLMTMRGASERVSRKFTECMADSSQETKACEVSVERHFGQHGLGDLDVTDNCASSPEER